MATKAQRTEQAQALGYLAEEDIRPGETLFTILRHVSASGMSRTIQVVRIQADDRGGVRIAHLGWNIAKALGYRYDRDREGVIVQGAGMDMGFHLVYSLSRALYPDGWTCEGGDCPANDHSNPPYPRSGESVGTLHHRDGGYAIKQRWI